MKATKEKLEGGLADGKTIKYLAKKHGVSVDEIEWQVGKGMKVEKEHTKDKLKAKEIVLDHLAEDVSYYSKLEAMESKKAKKAGEAEITKAFDLLIEGAIDTTLNGGDLFDNISKINIEKGFRKKDFSKLVKKKITDKTGQTRTVWVKVGEAVKEGIKKVSDKTKKVYNNQREKAGYDTVSDKDLTNGSNYIKRAVNSIGKAVVNEVKEWKSAGIGIKKFVKGEKLSSHEKKAIATVAIHTGIVVAMAISGETGVVASLGAKTLLLGKSIGIHFIEHSLGMNIAHALAFTKGDDSEKIEDDGGGDDEQSDEEAKHYLDRFILSMGNSMEREVKKRAEENVGEDGDTNNEQSKYKDGNSTSKDVSKED